VPTSASCRAADWLNDFARPCVGDEHGAGAGVGNRRALDAVVQLRDLRIHGGDLRLSGALLLLHAPPARLRAT